MLDSTKEVIAIISAAIGALVTGIPLLIGFFRKALQLIKERNWKKVIEILPNLIKEAENFINYSGTEKKEYVKSRLAVYTAKNKITFDEDKFNNAIDDIVKLTKEVNVRNKDKGDAETAISGVHPLTSNNLIKISE